MAIITPVAVSGVHGAGDRGGLASAGGKAILITMARIAIGYAFGNREMAADLFAGFGPVGE